MESGGGKTSDVRMSAFGTSPSGVLNSDSMVAAVTGWLICVRVFVRLGGGVDMSASVLVEVGALTGPASAVYNKCNYLNHCRDMAV